MVDATDFEAKELEVDADIVPVQRYKPVELLGQGSLGAVYRCVDRRLGKVVTVKCLLSITDDRVVSFHNEAKIASRLNHEGVIQILDFGITDGGRPFMVMEHFESRSLQDILKDHGRFSEQEAIELFLLVSEALAYLHENGVFHRDLKPSNILVGQDDTGTMASRLIDFNLSKTSQDIQSKTIVQGRTVVGTPAYMSPDQVAGQPYDEKSEIYSMGCLMYEVLTGQPPYSGDSALEVLNQHARGNLVPPQALVPNLSKETSDVVVKCLCKSPADRYQSVAELIEDLNGAEQRQHWQRTGGNTTIFSTSSVKGSRTNKGAYVFAAVIVVTGIGFLVALIFTSPTPQLPVIASQTDPFGVGGISDKMDDQITNGTSLAKRAIGSNASKVRLPYTCTDEDLKVLRGNKVIDELVLTSSMVSDQGIVYLADIPNLEKVELDRTQVKTLEHINSLKKLVLLSLIETKITDSSLANLKGMKNLRWLQLSRTNISDRGVANLSDLDALTNLDLSFTKVTDGCLTSLKKLKSLSAIHMNSTAVTYAGLRKFLLAMPQLNVLIIEEFPPVGNNEMARLEKEFPSVVFGSREQIDVEKMERRAAWLLDEKLYQESLRLYLKCAAQTEDDKLTGINVAIAKCYLGLNDRPRAFKTLEQSAQQLQSKGLLLEAIVTLDYARDFASASGDWKRAQKYAIQSIALVIKQSGPDTEAVANHYMTIGNLYMVQHRYKEATEQFEKAIAICNKIFLNTKDEEKAAIPMACQAECLRQYGKMQQSEAMYVDTLRVFRKHKSSLDVQNVPNYANALVGMTQLLHQQNRPAEALKINDETYELMKEHGFTHDLELLCLQQRASILGNLNRLKEMDNVNRMIDKLKNRK